MKTKINCWCSLKEVWSLYQMQINHQKLILFLNMFNLTSSHLQVCRLLYVVSLWIGDPKPEPNLGLGQFLQRDHRGGDGHHHPLRGARRLVNVVQGGDRGRGGEESGKGEQVHPCVGGDLTLYTHGLSLCL